jgi:cytochrome c oxidase subunit 4
MSTHDHEDHHGEGGHIVPVKFLVFICAILLVLTAVTVWVSKVDFQEIRINELNIWIAMGVACVKATIVGLFFMHLKWDRSFNALLFVGSIFFVGIFMAMTIIDTSEYQDAIIPGDSEPVQLKLKELGVAEPH